MPIKPSSGSEEGWSSEDDADADADEEASLMFLRGRGNDWNKGIRVVKLRFSVSQGVNVVFELEGIDKGRCIKGGLRYG